MKFVDRAKIFVYSGKGGKGCISFLREKFREFGGPDGGDGGDGGSVYIQGDLGMNTLYDLKMNQHVRAGNGGQGSGRHKTGRAGEDVTMMVPLGTVVVDFISQELMAEVVTTERTLLLKGGRGGKGNRFFHSQKNRVPYKAQPGEDGQEKVLLLELKVIADIGLVGLPNAGKSTLIKALTNAEPKIADYPFTTLTPNLGVMDLTNYRRVVIADIPGIIEGASDGLGLGFDFLRHIERTKILLFLIDASSAELEALKETYLVLKNELVKYDPEILNNKPHRLVFTKLDLLAEPEALLEKAETWARSEKLELLGISAISKKNLDLLAETIGRLMQEFWPKDV